MLLIQPLVLVLRLSLLVVRVYILLNGMVVESLPLLAWAKLSTWKEDVLIILKRFYLDVWAYIRWREPHISGVKSQRVIYTTNMKSGYNGRGANPLEDLQSTALISATLPYQLHFRGEGIGSLVLSFENLGVCCHQVSEIKEIRVVQKISVAIIHLIGERCGIKGHRYCGNSGLTSQRYYLTRLLGYWSDVAAVIIWVKSLGSRASTAIGINEWLAPQISEHWP